MVGHTGSTTGIVHADMILTRSKVKVKVTGLLNFPKLAKPCMLAAMNVSPLPRLSGSVWSFTFWPCIFSFDLSLLTVSIYLSIYLSVYLSVFN